MVARLLSVPFGEAATRALAEVVADLRGGDPLAPVTIAVPSAAAGVTLRRRLAGETGGLVGVAFPSLPQLIDRLAAPALAAAGARPVTAAVRRGHLRRAIRELEGGPLGPAAASPATERALDATISELDDVGDRALDALAARGPVAAATVALARRVRAACSASGLADRGTVARAAIAAVRDGSARLAETGPVVVHLPRRLRPAEVELLEALVSAGHPVAVLIGHTGDPVADEPADALLAQAAAALGLAGPEAPGGAGVPTAPPAGPPVDELVRAPDPAEEAAVAARLALAAIAEGTRPDAVAIRYRITEPYAALVHEQLDAAGIPHHAPAVRTLAQSVPGRVLLGALSLPEGGWRRSDVMAWWRSGPVLDLATGRPVPAARWDRLARQAGVVAGLDQWHQRLAQAAEARRQRLDAGTDTEAEADRYLDDLAALGDAVDALAARLAPPDGPATWAAWSDWLARLLDELLGGAGAAERWPDDAAGDRQALDAVMQAVAGLADLDGVDDPPTPARVRHALERELERRERPHGRFGHGVAVGPLADGVGADVDVVIVLGAAEGTFPPRGADDALIPDRDRRAAGGELGARGRTRGEEARDLLATLAGARRRRVLVAPRSDPRAQRERQPAAAFLEAAAAHAGTLVASGDLDVLRRGALAWFTDVESFEWWPAAAREERVPADVDLAALLGDHRAGRPVESSGPVLADPVLARGLAAGIARRRADFDAWSGNVGSRPDLLEGFDRPRSPTSLERYARCPFQFFVGEVLGVRPIDDPTDAEELSGRDYGTLVHAVLEAFIRERGIGKPPEEPWSDDDHRRIVEIADEVADRFEAEGRTGRPLLWGVKRDHLRRYVRGILDEDEVLRRTWRSTPVAVEHRFGVDGGEPVVVDLGGRTVAFKGVADRIDRTEAGGLLVLDYKTGGSDGFRELEHDLTGGGQKLQLGIYALAARRDHPGATQVDVRYWFVGGRRGPDVIGGTFDEAAEKRFRDVVGVVLDGIVAGRFPANPGDEEWSRGRYVFDHCRWCDFQRLCPSTRGWQWQQLRGHPELGAYVEITGGTP